MKKILIVILLLFLTSCTKIIGSLQDLVNPDGSSNIPDNPDVSVVDPSNDFQDNIDYKDVTLANGVKYHFADSLKENGPMTEECFPSQGTPKLLVIPVTFPDSNNEFFHLRKIKEDLNTCFNGTQRETGYYSLREFYQISSYNKLNLTADILDFFEVENNSSYYSQTEDGSKYILEEAINYYDKTIDFSDYDYDNDGFIDAVWLVYNHPIDFKTADFWWAYQTQQILPNKFDNKRTSYYGFAGVDFMYPNKNGNTYYSKRNLIIDAHTFIHETGHMMGLDDYYSYDTTQNLNFNYGTYGCDMMDHTHGDHGVLSKLLLGWIDPYIITDSCYVSLESFAKTGDAILIPDNVLEFKKNMTIYDHYYLIVCYDASLINGKDKPIRINDIFDVDGILIYECHAEKPEKPGFIGETYYTGFKYNNSDYKIFNLFSGFDYERSEWFVRFLTNGKETNDNNQILFQINDCLRQSKNEKTTVPFNFKVVRRDADSHGNLEKYVLSIKMY